MMGWYHLLKKEEHKTPLLATPGGGPSLSISSVYCQMSWIFHFLPPTHSLTLYRQTAVFILQVAFLSSPCSRVLKPFFFSCLCYVTGLLVGRCPSPTVFRCLGHSKHSFFLVSVLFVGSCALLFWLLLTAPSPRELLKVHVLCKWYRCLSHFYLCPVLLFLPLCSLPSQILVERFSPLCKEHWESRVEHINEEIENV